MSTIVLDAASERASELPQLTTNQTTEDDTSNRCQRGSPAVISRGKKRGRPPKSRDEDDKTWRGVAGPATFDFDKLPDSAWLLKHEVAQVLRRAPGTLEAWRRIEGHPLRWEKVDGRYVCSVQALRAYIVQAKGK
jgi:hypothetical protein